MDGVSGPKGDNFDESFVKQSIPHNTKLANGYFVQQRGDWQVTRLAVVHGLYSGCLYGGTVGLGAAIYSRQMRMIPKYAAYFAVPYAAFMGISTVYRLDI